VKEYELFLPLTFNDGSPIDAREIEIVGVEFRDAIVIFRVFTERTRDARRFFKKLKRELKVKFQQEEILIVEKEARLL
jgi:hypothetical protein